MRGKEGKENKGEKWEAIRENEKKGEEKRGRKKSDRTKEEMKRAGMCNVMRSL